MTKLAQLYQRRLVLTKELYEINGEIQALEKSNTWTASQRVHHANGCPIGRSRDPNSRYRYKKRTKNWALVDCINCHKQRAKRRPPNTYPKPGEDWERTVAK